MEYSGDGITGDEMKQNLFLIHHNIPFFHYSLAQTWHAINNFIDYTLEVLRRHYNVMEKSRPWPRPDYLAIYLHTCNMRQGGQGRPIFQN
jgi:uncharacterized membrane protein YpjA